MVGVITSFFNCYFFFFDRPRLFSKYVGDTEATIRNLFLSARKLSPSILVIDELDAIAAKRDEESGGVHDRALSTLLNEIDGVEGNRKLLYY